MLSHLNPTDGKQPTQEHPCMYVQTAWPELPLQPPASPVLTLWATSPCHPETRARGLGTASMPQCPQKLFMLANHKPAYPALVSAVSSCGNSSPPSLCFLTHAAAFGCAPLPCGMAGVGVGILLRPVRSSLPFQWPSSPLGFTPPDIFY